MQIDNSSSCSSSSTALDQTNRAADTKATGSSSKGPGATGSTSQTDGLQLSNFAGSLSKVLQSDSTDRSQRVAQLTAAVQSGSYQVDSQALSRTLVNQSISAGNPLP